MVSNFTRDTQAAWIGVQGLETDLKGSRVADLSKEVRKEVFNVKRMAAAVAGGILATGKGKSFWEGKSQAAQDWSKVFKEFEKAGGRTHFYGLDSVEDTAKKFANEVVNNPSKPKKAIQYLGNFFENYNAAVENGLRVSVFKSLIDRGVSKQKAANVARNLTVNFNRKGEWGSALSGLYMFANASIQGSAKLLTLAGKSKKVQALLGGQIALGFLVSLMNRLVGGDDEDNENRWETGVTRWEKYHNWIVMLPEGGVDLPVVGKVSRLKIPQPYGFNVFWSMGVAAEDFMNGKDRKIGDAALEIASVAATAFNPIGATSNWITTVTPTLARPFVEQGLNEDYAGRPIYPEREAPPHQQYFNSVSGSSKAVTKFLNDATGGTDVRPGDISINPELIDHYVSFIGGGTGTAPSCAHRDSCHGCLPKLRSH